MRKMTRTGIVLFLLLAVSLLSCTASANYVATEVSIAEIEANPETYQGEKVMVSGEYQGWSSECGSPPVTRSDWVITDETGCIYVTGKSAGLDPVEDVGTEITIIGNVCEKNSQAYLKAEIIIIRSVK